MYQNVSARLTQEQNSLSEQEQETGTQDAMRFLAPR